MVRLPTLQSSRQTLQTGSSFFRPTRDTSGQSIALGAQNLARGVGELAAAMTVRDERDNKFMAQSRMLDLEDRTNDFIRDQSLKIAENGKGFHDNTLKKIQKDAQNTLSTIAPELREEYDLRLKKFLNQRSSELADIEIKKNRSFVSEVTKRKITQLTGQVSSGLTSVEDARTEVDTFVNSVGLPKETSKVLKREFVRGIESAYVEKIRKENPRQLYSDLSRFMAKGASDKAGPIQSTVIEAANRANVDPSVMLMIAKLESNFKLNVKASKTIYGLFQLSRALRRKHGIPEELKGDPSLQSQAMAREIKEHQSRLEANGLAPTPTNIWASHFLGPGGSIAFLRANPKSDAFTVYRQVAGNKIAGLAFNGSNGDLLRKGMTVGQVLAKINGRVQTGLKSIDGLVNKQPSLGKDQPLVIAGKKLENLSVADMGQFYTGAVTDLNAQEDKAVKQQLVSQISEGAQTTVTNNVYDKAYRKNVDNAATELQLQQKLLESDDDAYAVTMGLAKKGYIPKPAANAVLNLMNNKQAPREDRMGALDIAAEVHRQNPTDGLRLSGINAANAKFVKDYVNLQVFGGLDRNEAMRRVEVMNSPDFKLKESDLRSKLEKTVRRRSFAEIDRALNLTTGSLWWKATAAPDSKMLKRRMEEQYQRSFRFHMLESNGDEDVAKANAIADLQRTNNFSRINGSKPTMMPFPPEYNYPPRKPMEDDERIDLMSDKRVNELFGYITKQARDAVVMNLQAAGIKDPEETAKDILLVPNGQTTQDITSRLLPRYNVMFKDSNGQWQLGASEFRADPQFSTTLEEGDDDESLSSGTANRSQQTSPTPRQANPTRANSFRAKRKSN